MLLDLLIHSLGLTIGLGVIRRRDVCPCPDQSMEVFHELGCELGPMITNHLMRDSELLPHMVAEELGGSHRRDFSGGWDSYDVLGESVNDHQILSHHILAILVIR